MNYSEKSMAVIILCTYVGIGKNSDVKPFTQKEWEELETVIGRNGIGIEHIIDKPEMLKNYQYSDQYVERIHILKRRGINIALELDGYERKGIKICTVFDDEYPLLLKKKLKLKTPPALFYVGNTNLAQKVGIGIVGSRNTDEDIYEFERQLVQRAVEEKLVIFSGGARGVDSIAEETALINGGAVVEFLADSLEKKIKKPNIIKALLNGQMLLFSDTKPEIGFTVAKAMNRNKLIYAASFGTFVIASDYNKGGTWAGATEALRNSLCKVFVWNNLKYVGNQKLINDKNALPFDLNTKKITESLFEPIQSSKMPPAQMSLWDFTG